MQSTTRHFFLFFKKKERLILLHPISWIWTGGKKINSFFIKKKKIPIDYPESWISREKSRRTFLVGFFTNACVFCIDLEALESFSFTLWAFHICVLSCLLPCNFKCFSGADPLHSFWGCNLSLSSTLSTIKKSHTNISKHWAGFTKENGHYIFVVESRRWIMKLLLQVHNVNLTAVHIPICSKIPSQQH